MGQLFEALLPRHVTFIEGQKIFFVGTAAAKGSVNLSPKGGDSLRVLDAHTLAWLNLTGSGNESAAQVLQQPRMTVMFCAFEGAPLILRAYGQARVLHRTDPQWPSLLALFPQASRLARSSCWTLNGSRRRAACRCLCMSTRGTGRILPTGRPVRAGRD
jgi:hypothetical protein